MSTAALNLPVSIPWRLIAVSPDMMDLGFDDSTKPYAWRSSLAIAAYEPAPEDIDEALCDRTLTYLKVSCTITGYQPAKSELEQGFVEFPNVLTEPLEKILGEYFACYGVLVNIGVFHAPRDSHDAGAPLTIPHHSAHSDNPLKDYPHIIDFEPKQRDFYQSASETGEILTSSQSGVQTDKSFTHSYSTESGWKLGASIGKALGPASTAAGAVFSATGELSHSRTETDQNSWTVHADASRQWRETQGTTTQLSQMYNLLQSYHVGTNRAVFLMLPRPHVLQPTNRLTFAPGLRMIEGVQEFFLIVERAKSSSGLCVEATLETGHFPEEVAIDPAPTEYEEDEVDFRVEVPSGKGYGDRTVQLESVPEASHTLRRPGWVVDTRPGRSRNSTVPEMDEKINADVDPSHISVARDYAYAAVLTGADLPTTVQVQGRITFKPDFHQPPGVSTSTGGAPVSSVAAVDQRTGKARFDRTYRIYTRSMQPKPATRGDRVTTPFFKTSRKLRACFRKVGGCLEPILAPEFDWHAQDVRIIDERRVALNLPGAGGDQASSSDATTKMLLRKLHSAMVTHSSARSEDGRSFVESDYFKDQIRLFLPAAHLERLVTSIEGIPTRVVEVFGLGATVADVLNETLPSLVRRTGLTITDVVRARRAILRYTPPGRRTE